MDREDNKAGNYLALDGGLSGLSGLVTLEELLSRLQFDLKLKEELAPWRHFNIIIGTGPGGLVAIFIGRLKMTASGAIEAYTRLLPALSVSPAKDDDERRRNTEAFKGAFLLVLTNAWVRRRNSHAGRRCTQNVSLLHCHLLSLIPFSVVITSNVVNLVSPYFIRSYRVRGSPAPPCTILQAACGCVASQERFLPVVIGEGHRETTLVDAMAGYANPTKELMREAQSIFGEEEEVATVLSLGAGKIGIGDSLVSARDELTEILKRGGAVCEQVHEDMHNRLSDTSVYFRFNVEKEMGTKPQVISAHTLAYLHESPVSKRLDQATKSIRSRSLGIKLKDINSVTVVEIQLKPRPSLVRNFVGRDDILEAMRQTHFADRSSESDTPAITVLSGLGGSGKTQIALKFAKEFEKTSCDTPVYFLNAQSEESLKGDFETLVRSLGAEHRSKSHDDALVWLATKLKNWLIILDNADNPKFSLFPYIPKSASGNVIITTRNATHATLAPDAAHSIEGLSEADSVSLVLKSSGYESTETNRTLATEIVRELGNLPLALAQAAGYIFVNKCLSTYLSLYRNSRIKILACSPSQRPDDYPSSVARTIEMSMDRLPPDAQDVMRLLAHLDASSVPHGIIAKAAERRFERVTWTEQSKINPETLEHAKALRSAFCADEEWSDFDFNEIVTRCLQYSLLRVTMQGDVKFYSMHILVQSYLKASSTLIRGHRPVQLVIRLLGSSFTYSGSYEYLAFNRLLLPHLRLIQFEEVVETGDHLGFGDVFYQTGDRRLALGHREKCLEMWKRSLGDEHENTMNTMLILGNSYRMLGRIQDALELEEQLLTLRMKLSGPDHPSTLLVMHNLAYSYFEVGRHEEAVEIREQVLDKRKKILGPEDPSTLMAMNNLAASYSGLGRVQDALNLDEQVLETRRTVLGPEYPDTLTSMLSVAYCYSELGREAEAMELREKVVELSTKVLGPEHPDTVSAMWSLGWSLWKLDQKERHLDLLRTAVPVYERAYGPDDERTIWARKEIPRLSLELKGRDAQSM